MSKIAPTLSSPQTDIGRFDADIDVIGPPELATAFADLAARYAKAARTKGPHDGRKR
ncbi:hypothetical protein ACIQCD_30750 [Streptomyces sp. NPDC093250]|uniref:hypothetical protein n=1 Tax=Streptomyces sp. NPDC093250 TaxID=3366036 RepID=UPI00380E6859